MDETFERRTIQLKEEMKNSALALFEHTGTTAFLMAFGAGDDEWVMTAGAREQVRELLDERLGKRLEGSAVAHRPH